MGTPLKVAVVVGSARNGSINMRYAKALEALAGASMTFDFLPVETLPLYNGDLEAQMPEAVADIAGRIAKADGVLFVSPEHNRSVTALMKNTLDWVSRAAGGNAWAGKRAAVCGASPGARGADLSQMHLRQIAVVLALEVLPQPEVYMSVRAETFAEDGTFTSERDIQFQQRFLQRFGDWLAIA